MCLPSLQTHWTVAVIFMQSKEVMYLDSFGDAGEDVLAALLKYVQDETADKLHTEFDRSAWKVRAPPDRLPSQSNGFDCGVFLCMFVDHLLAQRPFKFSQADAPAYRRYIAHSILSGAVQSF